LPLLDLPLEARKDGRQAFDDDDRFVATGQVVKSIVPLPDD